MNISSAPAATASVRLRSMAFTTLPIILLASVLLQGCSGMEQPVTKNRLLWVVSPQPTGRSPQAGRSVAASAKTRFTLPGARPRKTSTSATPHGVRECWTYTRTFNGYGGGYYGISRGLVHGKNGDHYNTDNFYPAPDSSQTLGGTPSTEVPVKRATFQNDRVVSVETTHADRQSDEADAGE